MTPDLFPMILAGHLVGDFFVQTDWQAANKEANWKACLQHALGYNVALALLVLPFWHTWEAWLFIAISFASHAIVDRRWPTRWFMRVTRSEWFSNQFWGVITTDQAIHLTILSVSYYLLMRMS